MKAIVHIGPPKTGTTSIQKFMRLRRAELEAAKYYIPRLKKGNMGDLAIASDFEERLRPADQPSGRSFMRLGITHETFPRIQAEMQENIVNKINEAKANNFKYFLVSAEGLGTGSAYTPRAFHNFFSSHFSEFRVVMALRRQDRASISAYANQVRFHQKPKQQALSRLRRMNYRKLINGWARVFGQECVHPFIFPDSGGGQSGLIERFCLAADIRDIHRPEEENLYRANESMDARALEILRNINALSAERGIPFSYNAKIRLEEFLKEAFPPPHTKVLPSLSEVSTFMEYYDDTNEYVRKKYFREQETLFAPLSASYPDERNYPAPTIDDMNRLMDAILVSPIGKNSPELQSQRPDSVEAYYQALPEILEKRVSARKKAALVEG